MNQEHLEYCNMLLQFEKGSIFNLAKISAGDRFLVGKEAREFCRYDPEDRTGGSPHGGLCD